MENDLVSIYENNYLQGSIVEEKSAGIADINKNGKIEGWEAARDKAIKNSMGESSEKEHDEDEEDEEDEDETHEEAVKRKLKKKSMKNKKTKKPVDAGEIYGDSFQRSENIFDQILREMDEMSGNYDSSSEESDNVFDTSEASDEDERTFTISELRNMTLGEIVSMLGGEEESEEEYSFEDEGESDQIPSESYGFTGGEGNHKGDQGTYDGKAKKQAPSSLVKANGDSDFSQADTEYDPEDTEGSEGSCLGDQGDYDGKAKKQAPSSHIKANGDADFSKAKLNYKTSSGKKDKNYF